MSSRNIRILEILLILVLASISCHGKNYKIPSYITLCKRNDPNLSKCFKKAFDDVRPYLPKGIPEMKIPPIEPFLVTKVELNSGGNFKAIFDNLKVYEASGYKLIDVSFDLDQNKVSLHLLFPTMRLVTDYRLDGKLLILELNGSGKADGNLTNVDVAVDLQGEREIRNGKEYINFKDNSITLGIGPSRLHFDDLFKNNEELTVATNKVINDNIDDILKELKPILQDTIASIVFEVVGNVFHTFSIDTLFPLD